MANTYTSLYYHVVFSTKDRFPWIRLEQRIWAYIGGIARKHNMAALQVGGIEDHIHALVMAPPTIAPCNVAKFLKGESSLWIHDESIGYEVSYGKMVTQRSQSVSRTCLML